MATEMAQLDFFPHKITFYISNLQKKIVIRLCSVCSILKEYSIFTENTYNSPDLATQI